MPHGPAASVAQPASVPHQPPREQQISSSNGSRVRYQTLISRHPPSPPLFRGALRHACIEACSSSHTRRIRATGKSLSLGKQAVTPAPASSQGSDLGLVTSRTVDAGEALVSVPESLWITAEVVAKSELGPAVAQLQEPWVQVPKASPGSAA